MKRLAALLILSAAIPAQAQDGSLANEIDRRAAAVNEKVIAWRRDLHEHPELGNQEVRTSKLVADHLRSLGMEVRTGVAHTGVVAVLKGGRPGPVVALRADMDALPVTELVDVPFKSKVRATYNGQEVGVMHACGHDTHVAMLLGAAEVLAGMRDRLPGTVKFIFQPAEEGVQVGETGGAALMLSDGAFQSPKPDVVFGLHSFAGIPAGDIEYKPGGMLASADLLNIVVRGKQTHAAKPWSGVDPIVAASQIVLALQTVVSRNLDLTNAPAIVTIGMIHGGVRNNIIPDSVVLTGTLRALDPNMRKQVHDRVREIAEHTAASAGATASVAIYPGYPVTMNDAELAAWAAPTLERVAGKGRARLGPPSLGAEDFSYFANEVPGFYVFLGITPPGPNVKAAAANHSPLFYVDESALPVGVRTLSSLAVDYMQSRSRRME